MKKGMVRMKTNKNASIGKKSSQSCGVVKNFMDNSSVGMKVVIMLFFVMTTAIIKQHWKTGVGICTWIGMNSII